MLESNLNDDMVDIQVIVEKTITTLLSKMGLEFKNVEIKEVAGQILYSITFNNEQEEVFLASNGEVLNSFSMLTSRIVERELGNNERVRITIDVNDYKKAKIDSIVSSAQVQADRAKELKYDVELQPANGYERMLVHAALSNDKELETGSIGEGEERRVVIKFVG